MSVARHVLYKKRPLLGRLCGQENAGTIEEAAANKTRERNEESFVMITFDTCVCVCVPTGLFKGHGGIELASHSMKETSCSAGDAAGRFCTETPTSVAAAMLSLLLWPWTEFKIECHQKTRLHSPLGCHPER